MTNAKVEIQHKDMAANMLNQSYDRIITIAQTLANLEAARADLAEIDEIFPLTLPANLPAEFYTPLMRISAIAALYRASDPVAEAIREMALTDATQDDADRLRKALASRGLEIVERRDR